MGVVDLLRRAKPRTTGGSSGECAGRWAALSLALATPALLFTLSAPAAVAEAVNPDPLNICGPVADNPGAPMIDQRNAVACLSNVARCRKQVLPMYNVAWLPESGRPVGRWCFSDGSGRFGLAAGTGTFVPSDQTPLARAAQAKADDIVRCGQFSHTACGRPADYWVRQTGYIPSASCWRWSENIYWSAPAPHSTARAAMTWWLGSPGHASNLLNPGFYDTGVGISRGPLPGVSDAKIWVQVFGYRYC